VRFVELRGTHALANNEGRDLKQQCPSVNSGAARMESLLLNKRLKSDLRALLKAGTEEKPTRRG
jgi:hypothetical protein